MPKSLERLKKLTLALEMAAEAKDWVEFNALLATREIEISRLQPGHYPDANEMLKLENRLQTVMAGRMDHLRTRMQATVHVNRTARAFQASQEQRVRVDFAG
jgi:hypothetical protein